MNHLTTPHSLWVRNISDNQHQSWSPGIINPSRIAQMTHYSIYDRHQPPSAIKRKCRRRWWMTSSLILSHSQFVTVCQCAGRFQECSQTFPESANHPQPWPTISNNQQWTTIHHPSTIRLTNIEPSSRTSSTITMPQFPQPTTKLNHHESTDQQIWTISFSTSMNFTVRII